MNPLQKWLIENGFLKADDPAENVEAAGLKAISDGKLTIEKYKELVDAESLADPVDRLSKSISASVSAAVSAAMVEVTKALKPAEAPKADEAKEPETVEPVAIEDTVKSVLEGLLAKAGNDGAEATPGAVKAAMQSASDGGKGGTKAITAGAHSDETGASRIDVKGVETRFSKSKEPIMVKGQDGRQNQFQYNGSGAFEQSELEKAMWGVWFKFTAFKTDVLKAAGYWNDEDEQLLRYVFATQKFYQDPNSNRSSHYGEGDIDSLIEQVEFQKSNGAFTKTILDETGASGGNAAVPEFFDTNGIIIPLLSGQLTPFVNTINVPRGSSARGYEIGNPAMTWGPVDGTAQTPFNDAGFFAPRNIPFHDLKGNMKFSVNWLADSLPNLAGNIQGRFAKVAARTLDIAIALGTGTGQPLGIVPTPGVIAVASQNAAAGPHTPADSINMFFGVPKEYRDMEGSAGNSTQRFCMNETSYARERGVTTGITGDTTLHHGNDIDSYTLRMRGVGLGQTMTNAQAFFAQLAAYRLYLRQGLVFYSDRTGETLRLENTELLTAHARYGGALERGSYAAVVTDWQS